MSSEDKNAFASPRQSLSDVELICAYTQHKLRKMGYAGVAVKPGNGPQFEIHFGPKDQEGGLLVDLEAKLNMGPVSHFNVEAQTPKRSPRIFPTRYYVTVGTKESAAEVASYIGQQDPQGVIALPASGHRR